MFKVPLVPKERGQHDKTISPVFLFRTVYLIHYDVDNICTFFGFGINGYIILEMKFY